jgi:hypothetical protein
MPAVTKEPSVTINWAQGHLGHKCEPGAGVAAAQAAFADAE